MTIKWKSNQDLDVRLAPGTPSVTISGREIPAETGMDGVSRVALKGNLSDCQTFGVTKVKNRAWVLILMHSGMVLAQAFKTSKDAKAAAEGLSELDIDWHGQSSAELVMSSPSLSTYEDLIQILEQVCGTGYYTPNSH